MASTLSDLLQSLRSDAEGKVEGDLSPVLMKALETYSRSYSATMTSLQKSYEKGLTGLEKKLGEMAAAYEASAVSNSEDARALIRELLTSQKKANQQQTDLNAQWRDLAESYFPQISKEQLNNEIAKRREQEKRMDLLKQELGISARRASTVKTEMQLLDSFKSFGKDPMVGSLVEAVKGKIQGGFDERTKAFDDLSKQRTGGIAAFQKSATDMYTGMQKGASPLAEKETTRETATASAVGTPLNGIEYQLGAIALALGKLAGDSVAEGVGLDAIDNYLDAQIAANTPPVASAGTPTPTQDNTPPVAQKLSEKAADAAIDKMMASQPELDTGVAPVAKNVATGALGSKVGALNLGGIGSALTSTISKGLSSLGNVLFKALGPLGWLASIGQSIDGVLPIFSSTFGALYDVLRLAGPFLTSLVLDSVTNLLSVGNMLIQAVDGIHEALSFSYKSVRTRANESGTLEAERKKAQAEKDKSDDDIGEAKGGFITYDPLAHYLEKEEKWAATVGGVNIRSARPTISRNETALTTPSEERAMAETATPAPAPASQDQSALVAALQRITAPQNPGTTAIMPSSPYLQTFAV